MDWRLFQPVLLDGQSRRFHLRCWQVKSLHLQQLLHFFTAATDERLASDLSSAAHRTLCLALSLTLSLPALRFPACLHRSLSHQRTRSQPEQRRLFWRAQVLFFFFFLNLRRGRMGKKEKTSRPHVSAVSWRDGCRAKASSSHFNTSTRYKDLLSHFTLWKCHFRRNATKNPESLNGTAECATHQVVLRCTTCSNLITKVTIGHAACVLI